LDGEEKFPCGKEYGGIEIKTFEIPKNWKCKSCIIKLTWSSNSHNQSLCVLISYHNPNANTQGALIKEIVEEENTDQEYIKNEDHKQENFKQEEIEYENTEERTIKQDNVDYENIEQDDVDYENIKQDDAEYRNTEQEETEYKSIEQDNTDYLNIAQKQIEYENTNKEDADQKNIKQNNIEREDADQGSGKEESVGQKDIVEYKSVMSNETREFSMPRTQKKVFNALWVILIPMIISMLFLCIIISKREHKETKNNGALQQLVYGEQVNRESNKYEKPLVEYKRPPAKREVAVQEKAINDKETCKVGTRNSRAGHTQVAMMQTEEIIQKAPETIQDKKLLPKSKINPETQIEEEKNTDTNSSTPVKDVSFIFNRDEVVEGKEVAKGVKLLIASKQNEEITDYKVMNKNGKAIWKNTHFIFILDCSNTMAGTRWNYTVDGYIECIKHLNGMTNIIISGFSFDTIRNPFCREKVPAKAPINKMLIPYTGKARKYERALKYTAQIIKRCLNKDYLSCVILISNGSGGYTDKDSKELLKQIEGERKMVTYIIGAACNKGEDKDMIKLARDLNGEYYSVAEPEIIGDVLLSVLRL